MARTFTRRWFSGGSDNDPAAASAYAAMTTAFLQVDRLLSEIEEGISAARSAEQARNAVTQWAAVREHHAQATSAYMRLQRPEPDAPYAAADVYRDCTRQLEQVSAQMAAFQERFGQTLVRAQAARQAAAQDVRRARVSANAAVAALDRPESLPFLQYPSVIGAVDALAAQIRALDLAAEGVGQAAAAAEVLEAATAVHTALAAAPGRASEAQNAIRSIGTRLSAVATRAEQMGPARSALLREFNAACSNDLVDNDKLAAAAAAAAEQELTMARAELAAGLPESALAHCALARDHLRAADDAVDAVADRLRSLREVRDDPATLAGKVRFRLRDAQQLAMQRDLVDEWGSVLDAQADRIDRACAALDGVHPDYWTYMSDLEAIDSFTLGVVDRMRGRG